MAVQTSYDRLQPVAYAGLKGSSMEDRVSSYKNALGRDVYTLTITAENSTVYFVEIQGVRISITSDGDATTQEIVDALEAAALASPWFSALATLVEASASTLTLRANDSNVDITPTVNSDIAAASVSSAGQNLPFGRIVALGAQSNEAGRGELCQPLSSGSNVIAGATVHTHAVTVQQYAIPDSQSATGLGADNTGYPPGEVCGIMQEGQIWLEAEEAMTTGAAVYARHTAGAGGSVIGRVRTDGDTSSALLVPNARVERYESALGLVFVTLNLPG